MRDSGFIAVAKGAAVCCYSAVRHDTAVIAAVTAKVAAAIGTVDGGVVVVVVVGYCHS
jgi:hypothetical protein